MLTINLVTETYMHPDDEPTDADIRTETVSLRELISKMREYPHSSCYPSSGATYEWLSRHETDYRTGADVTESIHYSRDNPARNARYWRIAMKAAGIAK